ncbi:MAG TPA: RNA polymerase sigma-70 factor [Solirubrobacterales bacterium]|nr:RNA polymerase sigma-70 factor [Solirubrobacterales bacterium]
MNADADRERLLAELRPSAFAVAYRMLGSVAEAEEVVQEALLRFNAVLERGEEISSPRAYLATVTTRLAIDELRSARARREVYVGEWLPEPLVAEPAEDPAARAEMADSLAVSFLVLLEQLSPEERAVLLLHDVFDYGYGEVAEVLGKSEANARQLAVRARRRVEEGRPRFEGSEERREELGDRFFAAAERGDLESLEQLLARDVVLRGDGGGKVPALARPLRGADRVARALVNWGRVGSRSGASVRRAAVNGQPGAIYLDPDGAVVGAMSVEIAGGEVVGVNSVVNPEKLAHLGPVGDMRALLRTGPVMSRSSRIAGGKRHAD